MRSGVGAVVLAAGQGTRFGPAFKLLAELEGVPLVRRVVLAALGSRVDEVLVVVGHREGEIRAALAGLAVTWVPNPDYVSGLSTSLRAGFRAGSAGRDGVVVMLGDMPLVRSDLVDGLISAWIAADRPDAVVPVHAGRRGNPVLLSSRLAPEIAALTGDAGAGPLLRGRPNVLEWPTEDRAVAFDVDTPAALTERS